MFSKKQSRGEIATTITLITLAFMVVGTFLGTRDTVRKSVKTYFSQAAEVKCLDRCSTENARNGNFICRDLKRSPLAKTLYWVTASSPTSCNLDNSCLCPAANVTPTGSANPAPTSTSGRPTVVVNSPTPISSSQPKPGSDFTPVSGVCRAQIVYRRDPIITSIEIKDKVSGNRFVINENTPVLRGEKFRKGISFDPGAGATVIWGPPEHSGEIFVLVNNGRQSDSQHYYAMPSWLGVNDAEVSFFYDRILGDRSNPREIQKAYQTVVGQKGCLPTPTSPSTTPTRTPTVVLRPFCGSRCTSNADCAGAPGIKNPICYSSNILPTSPRATGSPSTNNLTTPSLTGVCREASCPTSPTCGCPRATATPPINTPTQPINTPAATPKASPSPTPTPGSCPKNITFVLDTSSTMYTTGKLSEAINAIKNKAPRTDVSYRLVGFNRLVQNITTGFVSYDRLVSALDEARGRAGRGTNLPGVLANSAGTVILLTDGIPSYDSTGCFYGNSIEMSQIASQSRTAEGPQKLRATQFDPNEPASRPGPSVNCSTRPYGWALADSLQSASGKTIHAIEVKSGAETNSALLRAIGSGSYRNVSNLDQAVDQVIKQICPGTKTSTTSTTSGAQRPAQSQTSSPSSRTTSVTSTYNVSNKTVNRVVEELAVNLCDENQVCKEYVEKVNVQPGETARIPAVFHDLTQNGVYVVKCSLTYTDGSTEACPESQVTAGSAAKVSVNVSEEAPLAVETKTKEKPCDVNNDGSCNTLDYALTVAHYGERASESLASSEVAGDANLDGTVDATDISIILAGLGE